MAKQQFYSEEEFLDALNRDTDVPDRDWLHENFKSKSSIIRYLLLEKDLGVKRIAEVSGIPYRHVYSVVKQAKKETPTHICPVCKNRKG